MMSRRPATLAIVVEKRKVDDPERPPGILQQAAINGELVAQRSEAVVNAPSLVRTEEHEIAALCLHALEDFLDGLVG